MEPIKPKFSNTIKLETKIARCNNLGYRVAEPLGGEVLMDSLSVCCIKLVMRF